MNDDSGKIASLKNCVLSSLVQAKCSALPYLYGGLDVPDQAGVSFLEYGRRTVKTRLCRRKPFLWLFGVTHQHFFHFGFGFDAAGPFPRPCTPSGGPGRLQSGKRGGMLQQIISEGV